MRVDRVDELALELERHVPDEAQEQRAHVVVAQQQAPQRLDELGAELVLLELPDDRLHAVVDEHLPQRLRAAEQPLAQEPELLLEHVEGLGLFELLDLVLRRLERVGGLPVAGEVAIGRSRLKAHG